MLTAGPIRPGSTTRRLVSALTPLLFACAANASFACEAVAFHSSQLLYVDSQPELAWTAVAGATSYEIEIVARVPEGAVVERRSFRTGATTVDLPKLDASRPTKISLSVVATCGALQASASMRTMVVMPVKGCALTSAMAVRASAPERTVFWAATRGVEYEVRVFDAMTGLLTMSLQTDASTIAIPGSDPSVVAVRPRCGQSLGATSYLFIG